MLRAASAPFRAGTRFFSLPDMRFSVGDAEIRAPGELLPGSRDRNASSYLRRLAARFPHEPVCLDIEQPLLLDYPAWNSVRKALSGLWDEVGYPVMPVSCAFSLGRLRDQGKPGHAVLMWILQGEASVALRPHADRGRGRETILRGTSGDLLYWPSSHRASHRAREGGADCFAMRLSIPETPDGVHDSVEALLASLLQPRLYPDGRTPYLAFPARTANDGATVSPDAFVRLSETLRSAADGDAMAQALRVQWISRVSACGLEPVPAPQERPALRATDRVRLSDGARIVRMTYDAATMLWAANGYAFAVENAARYARLHAALSDSTHHRVGDFFRPRGAATQDRALSALLDGLHAVRAIELAGPDA